MSTPNKLLQAAYFLGGILFWTCFTYTMGRSDMVESLRDFVVTVRGKLALIGAATGICGLFIVGSFLLPSVPQPLAEVLAGGVWCFVYVRFFALLVWADTLKLTR
jgi:hypothetical protein